MHQLFLVAYWASGSGFRKGKDLLGDNYTILYIPLILTDFYKQFKLAAEWCSFSECPGICWHCHLGLWSPAAQIPQEPQGKPAQSEFWRRVWVYEGQLFWEGGQRLPNQTSKTWFSSAVNHFLLVPGYLWSPWNRSHPSQHTVAQQKSVNYWPVPTTSNAGPEVLDLSVVHGIVSSPLEARDSFPEVFKYS